MPDEKKTPDWLKLDASGCKALVQLDGEKATASIRMVSRQVQKRRDALGTEFNAALFVLRGDSPGFVARMSEAILRAVKEAMPSKPVEDGGWQEVGKAAARAMLALIEDLQAGLTALADRRAALTLQECVESWTLTDPAGRPLPLLTGLALEKQTEILDQIPSPWVDRILKGLDKLGEAYSAS